MDTQTEKIYCSLDIETSGFDPLKNEILEVGLVFFELGKSGIKITDQYTKVFKPKGPVSSTILGLTGIAQKELDEASAFSEYAKELQDKVQGAVIVGHNVIFDIKFLESAGIEFSGEVIDTLDLVQFILPTHHSYNLENLMHVFGVSHKNAHRALADAKATTIVLDHLLQTFGSFSAQTKEAIITLAKDYNFHYWPLLEHAPVSLPEKKKEQLSLRPPAFTFPLAPNALYNFPIGKNCLEDLVGNILLQKQKVLLVVPKTSQVMKLWKEQAVTAIFAEHFLFDEKKFAALLGKKNKTPEEVKFIFKVLVWHSTNWQTESLFDLNLSFFGGQFKSLVTGKKNTEKKQPLVVCCDMETLATLKKKKLYQSRFLVVVGLNEFEQYVSSSLSAKASWSYMSYLLKSFYNPELGTGNASLKITIEEALLKTDLFFGLVNALLKQDGESFQYYTITPENAYAESFQKIKKASENFAAFLGQLGKKLASDEMINFAKSLESFFEADPSFVKWIELSESRCVLYSSPLDIHEPVAELLHGFKKIAFADSLGNQQLVDYFLQRLGQQNLQLVWLSKESFSKQGQGELFDGLKQTLRSLNKHSVKSIVRSEVLSSGELLTLIKTAALPAAVLFGSVPKIKEFYDEYYQTLQEKAFLIAQTSSGGSNKMFHNFAIHNNSLLLVTGKTIIKHVATSTSIEPVNQLPVKTLIICNLPFEQYTHPYSQAVAARFENPFEQYSLPKAVYNFHAILEFFNSDELEHIYLCDSKLAKGYGKVFTDYLLQLPGVKTK